MEGRKRILVNFKKKKALLFMTLKQEVFFLEGTENLKLKDVLCSYNVLHLPVLF